MKGPSKTPENAILSHQHPSDAPGPIVHFKNRHFRLVRQHHQPRFNHVLYAKMRSLSITRELLVDSSDLFLDVDRWGMIRLRPTVWLRFGRVQGRSLPPGEFLFCDCEARRWIDHVVALASKPLQILCNV